MRANRPRWGITGTMTLIVLVINVPIIMMVLNSFQTTADIRSSTS